MRGRKGGREKKELEGGGGLSLSVNTRFGR